MDNLVEVSESVIWTDSFETYNAADDNKPDHDRKNLGKLFSVFPFVPFHCNVLSQVLERNVEPTKAAWDHCSIWGIFLCTSKTNGRRRNSNTRMPRKMSR